MSVTAPAKTSTCWITLELVARFDKECGRWVVGNPELDVWSSGSTPQEAVERADEAITLFLEETTETGAIWEILKRAGIEPREAPDAGESLSLFGRLKNSFSHQAFLPAVFRVPNQAVAHC